MEDGTRLMANHHLLASTQRSAYLPGDLGDHDYSPEEYKEFLHLGHGGIFDLDLNNVDMLHGEHKE